jgi:hypothetical protein
MRNIYQDDIRMQLNDLNLFRKVRKKQRDELKLEGNGFIVALHSGRNYAGVMATGESGLLGSAGQQSVDQLSIPFRDIKGRFGITLEVIEAAASSKAAAVPALEFERNRLVEDIERQSNRQFWGSGAGTLAVVQATATSTTQTLKNPGGVAGTVNPARFVQPGMVVADLTGATLNQVATVSSVNQSAGTIVISASQTWTINDTIALGSTDGTNNNSSNGIEMMGVNGIVDSSTYLSTIFGLTRSSKPFFQSGVVTGAGALSEDFLYRQIHDRWVVSGKRISDFYTGPDVVREYIKLTQPDRRYMGGDLKSPDAGVTNAAVSDSNESGLTFCGIPLTVDKDAPYGSLFGLVLDHLFVAYLNEGQWEDFGGSTGQVLRFVSNKTNYEGVFYRFLNMYSDRGNVHFRVDGITTTVDSGIVAD